MNIPITEAKAQLTELVRRAEQGETIVLTRHGKPAVRLVPTEAAAPRKLDRASIDRITASVVAKLGPSSGPPGDHSFLYDDDGLPG